MDEDHQIPGDPGNSQGDQQQPPPSQSSITATPEDIRSQVKDLKTDVATVKRFITMDINKAQRLALEMSGYEDGSPVI